MVVGVGQEWENGAWIGLVDICSPRERAKFSVCIFIYIVHIYIYFVLLF